jgi:hypothetical protein
LSRQLYINEHLVDLSPDEPIPLTYQVNNIAELENRQANFSNTFSVPDTGNNKNVLGFSNKTESNTNIPYRKLPMTYIQNGVPIFVNGVAIVEEFNGKYSITLYSGMYDFFSQLGDLTLKDIDWSSFNHTYDVNTVVSNNVAYLNGTSDTCMPLINWGAVLSPVDIKYQCFALRYSTIIDKIFNKTSYTKSGEIFNHGIYLDQALTLSPDQQETNDVDLEARSLQVLAPGGLNDYGVTITNGPNISNLLALFSVDYNTSTNLIRDFVNPKTISYPASWIPPQTLNTTRYRSTYYGTVQIDTNLLFTTIRLTGSENYRVFKNNILIRIIPIGDYPDSSGDVTAVYFNDSFTVDVKPGDEIKIQFYAIKWSITNTSSSVNSVSIQNISTIPLGGTANYNYLVPDLKLKDIIKSFCQEFGLIVTSNQNEIIFTQFSEIKKNIDQAEDWSDKLDTSIVPTINYRIGDYCQNNYFKWKPDDGTKGFGDSSFSINDTTLNAKTDLFEMLYPSALPVENIRGITYKFKTLPLEDYFDLPTWQLFHAYSIGDEVGKNGVIYVCIQNITGLVAIDYYNTSYWQIRSDQYSTDTTNQGVYIPRFTKIEADVWDQEKTYEQDDQVNYGGIIYVAIATTTGNNPSSPDSLAYWEVRTLQYEQTISSDSRLVLIRPIYRKYPGAPNGDNITYTDGVNNVGGDTATTPMAYWSDALEPYNLTGQYLLENYYKELINMFINLKVVTCFVRLTDADISNLDFLKLKYIKNFGNYFYLNIVEDYVSNESVKAQLVRM